MQHIVNSFVDFMERNGMEMRDDSVQYMNTLRTEFKTDGEAEEALNSFLRRAMVQSPVQKLEHAIDEQQQAVNNTADKFGEGKDTSMLFRTIRCPWKMARTKQNYVEMFVEAVGTDTTELRVGVMVEGSPEPPFVGGCNSSLGIYVNDKTVCVQQSPDGDLSGGLTNVGPITRPLRQGDRIGLMLDYERAPRLGGGILVFWYPGKLSDDATHVAEAEAKEASAIEVAAKAAAEKKAADQKVKVALQNKSAAVKRHANEAKQQAAAVEKATSESKKAQMVLQSAEKEVADTDAQVKQQATVVKQKAEAQTAAKTAKDAKDKAAAEAKAALQGLPADADAATKDAKTKAVAAATSAAETTTKAWNAAVAEFKKAEAEAAKAAATKNKAAAKLTQAQTASTTVAATLATATQAVSATKAKHDKDMADAEAAITHAQQVANEVQTKLNEADKAVTAAKQALAQLHHVDTFVGVVQTGMVGFPWGQGSKHVGLIPLISMKSSAEKVRIALAPDRARAMELARELFCAPSEWSPAVDVHVLARFAFDESLLRMASRRDEWATMRGQSLWPKKGKFYFEWTIDQLVAPDMLRVGFMMVKGTRVKASERCGHAIGADEHSFGVSVWDGENKFSFWRNNEQRDFCPKEYAPWKVGDTCGLMIDFEHTHSRGCCFFFKEEVVGAKAKDDGVRERQLVYVGPLSDGLAWRYAATDLSVVPAVSMGKVGVGVTLNPAASIERALAALDQGQ